MIFVEILAVSIDPLFEAKTPLVSAKSGVYFEVRPNPPIDRENVSAKIGDANGVRHKKSSVSPSINLPSQLHPAEETRNRAEACPDIESMSSVTPPRINTADSSRSLGKLNPTPHQEHQELNQTTTA